jgi:uncharacterized Zn finger protein
MSIVLTLGCFFKSDAMAAGAKLHALDKVSIPSGSDTSINAYIRVSPPLRVQLASEGIEAESLTADCNCPAGKKGRLCKHVWAALLAVEEEHPDFLHGKTSVEKVTVSAQARAAAAPTERALASAKKHEEYAAASKARAAEYRKAQYQRAKERAKERSRGRPSKKEAPPEVSLVAMPPEVEAACAYFLQNGFPMVPGPSIDAVAEAKKKLSRVFHPDKGGTHEEITELNQHWEAIVAYLDQGEAQF